MRKFNEWRTEENSQSDPNVFIKRIHDLMQQLDLELKAFQGERFEGFLNILGGVKNLQRTLAEIDNGVEGNQLSFLTQEDCGEPHKPGKMKKVKHKKVISKGVRSGEDDLSSDYKGHIAKNGDEEPFRVMENTGIKDMDAVKKGVERLLSQLADRGIIDVGWGPILGGNAYYFKIGEKKFKISIDEWYDAFDRIEQEKRRRGEL